MDTNLHMNSQNLVKKHGLTLFFPLSIMGVLGCYKGSLGISHIKNHTIILSGKTEGISLVNKKQV